MKQVGTSISLSCLNELFKSGKFNILVYNICVYWRDYIYRQFRINFDKLEASQV